MPANFNVQGQPLGALLEGLATVPPEADVIVTGVAGDSRSVKPGDLFLALHGQRDHGARHAREAVNAGAVAVVAEGEPVGIPDLPGPVPVINVRDLAATAGLIAARFHGHPSRHMHVVGITGTNGKTSTSHYVACALDHSGLGRAGLIGTLGYGPVGNLGAAHMTTPDAFTLQAELARQRLLGVRFVAMEVSSHALAQDRIAGTRFAVVVFTNLTRDHLDYHGDMAAYGAAKRRLFFQPEAGHAVVNLDDEFGRELFASCIDRLPVTGYRLVDGALPGVAPPDVLVGAWRDGSQGEIRLSLRGPHGEGELRCGLTGRFNASNVLATVASLCALGIPFAEALALAARIRPVPGRMEPFSVPGRALVVVDYAHTPDALEQALLALRPQCRGRLICVFGCGGDRDPGKRPQMGAIAERHADLPVITSDNPRSEDPAAIIAAIGAGMNDPARAIIEPDRAAAIAAAIDTANGDDIVLVAGKGHETTQEIAGLRHPFSDRQVVRNLLGVTP